MAKKSWKKKIMRKTLFLWNDQHAISHANPVGFCLLNRLSISNFPIFDPVYPREAVEIVHWSTKRLSYECSWCVSWSVWACYHIHLAVAWVKLICFTLNFTHREETKTGVFLNLKTRKGEILSLLTSSLSDKAKWRPLWTFKTESSMGISHSFQNYKKLLSALFAPFWGDTRCTKMTLVISLCRTWLSMSNIFR